GSTPQDWRVPRRSYLHPPRVPRNARPQEGVAGNGKSLLSTLLSPYRPRTRIYPETSMRPIWPWRHRSRGSSTRRRVVYTLVVEPTSAVGRSSRNNSRTSGKIMPSRT
ncbi:hypothetical protein H257_18322, partial [Aphanomyces astaci]